MAFGRGATDDGFRRRVYTRRVPSERPPRSTAATSEATAEIRFRPLEDGDLRRMHGWLSDPAVVEWWEGRDVSWPAVVQRYGSGRTDAIEHWIALHEGEPIGWLQCYAASSEAQGEAYHWRAHLDLAETGAIDYLVAREAKRGRGLGSSMLRAFVRDVAFPRHPEWRFVAAGPFEANVPSCRALEKAGFERRATLDDEAGPCVLMVASRADDPNAVQS